MGKTKIEPFDFTWNSVIGCKTGCEYCWARSIARRFAGKWGQNVIDQYKLKNFEPIWLEHKFNEPFPKKPSKIIVGWMSDIYWWEKEWVEKVLTKIKEYPQHQFFFLTKFPAVYFQYSFPDNCWLGITETGLLNIYDNIADGIILNKKFISYEPLLALPPGHPSPDLSWAIIGALTGRKVMCPKRKWVEEIVNQCKEKNIPIWMKDSLKSVWGVKLLKEAPWGKSLK